MTAMTREPIFYAGKVDLSPKELAYLTYVAEGQGLMHTKDEQTLGNLCLLHIKVGEGYLHLFFVMRYYLNQFADKYGYDKYLIEIAEKLAPKPVEGSLAWDIG